MVSTLADFRANAPPQPLAVPFYSMPWRSSRLLRYVLCQNFYTLPPPRVHFAGRFLPIFYLALPPGVRQRERPLENTCEHLLHCRLNCCCLRFPFCEILVSVTGDLRKVRHLTRISFRRHSTPVSLLICHYAGSRVRDIDAGRPANRCRRKKEERCSCLTTIDRCTERSIASISGEGRILY